MSYNENYAGDDPDYPGEFTKSRTKFPRIQNNITMSIDLLVSSFKNLYPDFKRRIIINPDPNLAVKPNKKIPLGFTDFSQNKKDPVVIHISANICLSQMLDILAHELAHVVRGEEFTIKNEHDAKWKKIYSDIRKEYHRLLKQFK